MHATTLASPATSSSKLDIAGLSDNYRPARLRAAELLAVSAVSWLYPLYSHPGLRGDIEQQRGRQRAPARLPIGERAGDESIRVRLRTALDDNKRLREEIAALRDELALAHGRVRELELARRAPGPG
jgi:hypothetical protein